MKKIVLSVVWVILSGILLVISAVLAEEKIINTSVASAFTVVSVLLVVASVFYAAKVDYETGVYECKKCGHIFKPTFKEYLFGAHTPLRRCLKCHKCGERSWCVRKFNKKF